MLAQSAMPSPAGRTPSARLSGHFRNFVHETMLGQKRILERLRQDRIRSLIGDEVLLRLQCVLVHSNFKFGSELTAMNIFED